MFKRIAKPTLCAVAVLLTLLLLVTACVHSNQASRAFPLPIYFEGEYSQQGSDFRPLTDQTRLNALEGDLLLRGSLSNGVASLACYLDHIHMTLTVNGEVLLDTFPPAEGAVENACGNLWRATGEIPEGAAVEIRLSNPHDAGNPQAYTDFLRNLYTYSGEPFTNFILYPSRFLTRNLRAQMDGVPSWLFLFNGELWRWGGGAVIVLALLLLGVALADRHQRHGRGTGLTALAAFVLFSGGAMLLDTTDVALWCEQTTFTVYGAQSCRMLAALFLTDTAAQCLHGRRRMLAMALTAMQLAGVMTITLICLLGGRSLCDTVTPWLVLQGACMTALAGCCLWESRGAGGRAGQAVLLPLGTVLLTCLSELLNARFGWWRRGTVLGMVLLLMMMAYLVWTIIHVPGKYRKAKRVEQMERELTDGRIAIMLSQIQPHFLYNALTAIARLCDLDPPKAKSTTLAFADYLRGNLDALTEQQPILFGKELQHTRIYTDIEGIRFGDKLRVTYDIQTEDFLIPALTLQPLVENAVKHGVGKRLEGGGVCIAAREEAKGWRVTVSDDGVGFDPAQLSAEAGTHVGIANVRHRLTYQSGGTLTITSAPGAGTTAEIFLPKEKVDGG